MSADLLRRAAVEMRERARSALADSVGDGPQGTLSRARRVTVESHAQHIASWHPAVALAVADLFRRLANDADRGGLLPGTLGIASHAARAYLGEES